MSIREPLIDLDARVGRFLSGPKLDLWKREDVKAEVYRTFTSSIGLLMHILLDRVYTETEAEALDRKIQNLNDLRLVLYEFNPKKLRSCNTMLSFSTSQTSDVDESIHKDAIDELGTLARDIRMCQLSTKTFFERYLPAFREAKKYRRSLTI